MPPRDAPALYGINKDNSSRHGDALWGKNQFNSTFPLSLCLLMRDSDVNPVAVVATQGKIATADDVWRMDEVVGSASDKPFYHFEKAFTPYQAYSRNVTDKIDLVVAIDGDDRIPIEVKLTVVPDSTTMSRPRRSWAPEMVMRPVSSAHAMMGVASQLSQTGNETTRQAVIDTLKPAYNAISGDAWANTAAIVQNRDKLKTALRAALLKAEPLQQPFLMQPIWKTEGQSLVLSQQCFDVFVWSDVAITLLPTEYTEQSAEVSRPLREVARHVRSLYDLLVSGDFDYEGIYKGMPLGNQTDKAFSLPGNATHSHLNHTRLQSPRFDRATLEKLILHGGESRLKPERRFDAAVLGQMISRQTPSG